jgi:sigma-B regulation protein RsbU (phosphoserine phosphatase)
VSLPATEVGGDYYDYFVDGDRVAVVCGDVAGHGLASGLVLASLRAGFTLLRESLHDPAAVLKRLHDLVAQTSRRRMLATAAVVLIDRTARRATVASAGHPPILVRRDGSVRTIDLYAPPLGVRLPVEIPQIHLDLLPGDLFVLHSDGVYESRNAADEVYGFDRLADLVRTHPPDADARSLRDAIARDVEAFRTTQDDDVTIVVAKVLYGALSHPPPGVGGRRREGMPM